METVRLIAPKYNESKKSETCAFRCQSRLWNFCCLSLAWITNTDYTQSQDLWVSETLPDNVDVIGDPDSLQLPQLAREVLGTGQLPDKPPGICWLGFKSPGRRGGVLLSELLSGQGIQDFPGNLAFGVDLAPGLERFDLLGVDPNETVHVLASFF